MSVNLHDLTCRETDRTGRGRDYGRSKRYGISAEMMSAPFGGIADRLMTSAIVRGTRGDEQIELPSPLHYVDHVTGTDVKRFYNTRSYVDLTVGMESDVGFPCGSENTCELHKTGRSIL